MFMIRTPSIAPRSRQYGMNERMSTISLLYGMSNVVRILSATSMTISTTFWLLELCHQSSTLQSSRNLLPLPLSTHIQYTI